MTVILLYDALLSVRFDFWTSSLAVRRELFCEHRSKAANSIGIYGDVLGRDVAPFDVEIPPGVPISGTLEKPQVSPLAERVNGLPRDTEQGRCASRRDYLCIELVKKGAQLDVAVLSCRFCDLIIVVSRGE